MARGLPLEQDMGRGRTRPLSHQNPNLGSVAPKGKMTEKPSLFSAGSQGVWPARTEAAGSPTRLSRPISRALPSGARRLGWPHTRSTLPRGGSAAEGEAPGLAFMQPLLSDESIAPARPSVAVSAQALAAQTASRPASPAALPPRLTWLHIHGSHGQEPQAQTAETCPRDCSTPASAEPWAQAVRCPQGPPHSSGQAGFPGLLGRVAVPGVEQGAFQCRKQGHALDAVRRGAVNDGRELGPLTETARVSAPHRRELEGWCSLPRSAPGQNERWSQTSPRSRCCSHGFRREPARDAGAGRSRRAGFFHSLSSEGAAV